MNWSGVRAEEKIFHNVAVMREIVFYLNLEDTLCLLESKVGRFEEVKEMLLRRILDMCAIIKGVL